MEIESAHTHDVYDGHSTRGIQAIGGRSASKIEMAAYRNTPLEQERISDLMNIIPKGPEGKDSVLDVGARDGYLTRLLTERFASVTALDLEKPSIAHDRITCVEGDVTRLELASGSFDVVLCAEVLEHIPGKGLEQACRELSRVAKSHVVIGVPYRQDTRVGRTTCQSCGRSNPPWGHVNVFDERRLTELFLPLQKVGMTFVGSSRSRTNALSSWLMDVAGNPWGTYDQEEVCIHCGQEIGKPSERNLAQKLCSRLAFSLNAAQSRFISARPNWIHMVFYKHRQIESRRHSFKRSASSDRLASVAAPERKPRRLLFIAYQFAPSLEMGARSCAQIARYLPRHGWSPVVLTAQEKYIEERYRGSADEIAELGLPDTIVRTRLLPHPFDLYRWLRSTFRRKTQDAVAGAAGTNVEADTPLSEKGKLRRLLLSALSIPDIYTGWILPAIVAGLKAARQSSAEQIFSSGPFWTRLVVTRATAVVGVTEEHAVAFRQTYRRLPAEKFAAVPNGYDSGEWDNLPAGMRRDEKSEGKFLIVYAGKFYIERDPLPLFCALKKLIDSGEIAREQIQVDLVGWCATSEGRSVREMAVECGVSDCVKILGPRSRPETLRRMTEADLLLLLAERFVIQIPGKTYEYLRAGRPILALTPEGALANLLRRIGGGLVVNPNDTAGVLAAVRESVLRWKQGRVHHVADPGAIAGFDRRVLAGRLTELFDRLSAKVEKRHE